MGSHIGAVMSTYPNAFGIRTSRMIKAVTISANPKTAKIILVFTPKLSRGPRSGIDECDIQRCPYFTPSAHGDLCIAVGEEE
jgi:hypothetical protein